MAFGFTKPRCSPIAIDFGADRLKLLQIVPGNPPQLVAAAAAVIPGDMRTSPAKRMAFLGGALKQLIKAQPFKGRRVICSIPAHQTLIQHVEVPHVEGAELDEQVALHLMERLGMDPGKMVIRTTPVALRQRDGSTTQEVVCQAAPRDVVMGYIRLAEQARLDVVGMHPESATVLKAFEHTHSRRAEDTTRVACYIDLGAAATKVVIAEGFTVRFAKSIQVGRDQVTETLAQRGGLSFDEIRQARVEGQARGLTATPAAAVAGGVSEGMSGGMSGGGDRRVNAIEHGGTGLAALDIAIDAKDTDAASAPDPEQEMIDTLADELRLCLRHHHTICPDKPVDRLVFLGGGAKETATCQAIAKAVHTAAQLGDPFARLVRIGAAKNTTGVNLDQPQPGWAVPFGLCHCDANL